MVLLIFAALPILNCAVRSKMPPTTLGKTVLFRDCGYEGNFLDSRLANQFLRMFRLDGDGNATFVSETSSK